MKRRTTLSEEQHWVFLSIKYLKKDTFLQIMINFLIILQKSLNQAKFTWEATLNKKVFVLYSVASQGNFEMFFNWKTSLKKTKKT